MNTFTPSMLLESSKYEAISKTIDVFNETEIDSLASTLQFDLDIQRSEMDLYKRICREQYFNEQEVLNENIFEAIGDFIVSIIEKIKDFFSSLFGGSSSTDSNSVTKGVANFKKLYEEFKKNKNEYQNIIDNIKPDNIKAKRYLYKSYKDGNTSEEPIRVDLNVDYIYTFINQIEQLIQSNQIKNSDAVNAKLNELEGFIKKVNEREDNGNDGSSGNIDGSKQDIARKYYEQIVKMEGIYSDIKSNHMPSDLINLTDKLYELKSTWEKNANNFNGEDSNQMKNICLKISALITAVLKEYYRRVNNMYELSAMIIKSFNDLIKQNPAETNESYITSSTLFALPIHESYDIMHEESDDCDKYNDEDSIIKLIEFNENVLDEYYEYAVIKREEIINEMSGGVIAAIVAICGAALAAIISLFKGGSGGGGGGGGGGSYTSGGSNVSRIDYGTRKVTKRADSVANFIISYASKFNKNTTNLNTSIRDIANNISPEEMNKKHTFKMIDIDKLTQLPQTIIDSVFDPLMQLKVQSMASDYFSNHMNELDGILNKVDKIKHSGILNHDTVSINDFYDDLIGIAQELLTFINSRETIMDDDKSNNLCNAIRSTIKDVVSKIDDFSKSLDADKIYESITTDVETTYKEYLESVGNIHEIIGAFSADAMDDVLKDIKAKSEDFIKSKKIEETLKSIHDALQSKDERTANLHKNLVKVLLTISGSYSKIAAMIEKIIMVPINVFEKCARDLYNNIAVHGQIETDSSGRKVFSYKEMATIYSGRNLLAEATDVIDMTLDQSFAIAIHECETAFNLATIRAINEETRILASALSPRDKMIQLAAIKEAEENDKSSGWKRFVASVKEIFSKVIDTVAHLGTTKGYLDKNKKIILNQNFVVANWQTREIIGAIKKILNFTLPQMNYNSMAPDLDDPVVFYKKHIGPSMNHNTRVSNVTTLDQITTMDQVGSYCNDYFLGGNVSIPTSVIQQNIQEIYDYMYDYRKFVNKINSDIKQVDKECQSIMKQNNVGIVNDDADKQAKEMKQDAGLNQGTASTGAENSTTPTSQNASAIQSSVFGSVFLNENGDVLSKTDIAVARRSIEEASKPVVIPRDYSCYSYLYGTTINEAFLQEAEKTGSTGAVAGATGTPADRMKNFDDTPAPNGVNNNSNMATGEKTTVENHCKNYAAATTMVLKAKLTAVQFTHKEFDQIIRDHVKNSIEGKTTMKK